jgi:hypothetical protein
MIRLILLAVLTVALVAGEWDAAGGAAVLLLGSVFLKSFSKFHP